MAAYICDVCNFLYDEDKEGAWADLSDDWVCPVCGAIKSYFTTDEAVPVAAGTDKEEKAVPPDTSIDNLRRSSDELEEYMTDIHTMAETGRSVIEPMRTKKAVVSWDDILVKGAQLNKIPLNHEDKVDTTTVIGPGAAQPLTIETPIYISHMSYGALSREVKIALAKGSAAVKTAICSGEGGILPEEKENAYKYIFEYVPNRYSVSDETLQAVDAIEIKIGQSSKPGMGGHLPGDKVTEEIARVRGFEKGKDIISPAHFEDILNADDLKKKVDWLRDKSKGRPVGVKIAAGHIEVDLEIIVASGADFITIDGRPGATGAAPKYIKAATSIPTIYALHHARNFLDVKGATDISLIITGGLRTSADFAKALALGANAIAIATAALITCGCQQYRVCNTGQCPVGICTQDTELRKRLNIDQAAHGLENYMKVCTEELSDFARLTGNDNIHRLGIGDLCTTNSELSMYTDLEHV